MKKKKVIWMVDSKERLMEFPDEVRRNIGFSLGFAENGEKHPTAKPLKGFGSGVFEIVEDSKAGTFRAVYAVQIDDHLYVLHAFQKKSKSGIATPKKEINLVKQRLKMAVAQAATNIVK